MFRLEIHLFLAEFWDTIYQTLGKREEEKYISRTTNNTDLQPGGFFSFLRVGFISSADYCYTIADVAELEGSSGVRRSAGISRNKFVPSELWAVHTQVTASTYTAQMMRNELVIPTEISNLKELK